MNPTTLSFNPTAYLAALIAGIWLGWKLGTASQIEITEDPASAYVEGQRETAPWQ